jgi:succinate dehydrogenase hydrophobic anchor subunit
MPSGSAVGAGSAASEPETGVGGTERSWAWHLNRVLALFLAILVPLHFAVVIIGGDVGRTTAASVTAQFTSTSWRGLTWLLILFALAHTWLSWFGIQNEHDARADDADDADHATAEPKRMPAAALSALVGAAVLAAAASYVLFTYR